MGPREPGQLVLAAKATQQAMLVPSSPHVSSCLRHHYSSDHQSLQRLNNTRQMLFKTARNKTGILERFPFQRAKIELFFFFLPFKKKNKYLRIPKIQRSPQYTGNLGGLRFMTVGRKRMHVIEVTTWVYVLASPSQLCLLADDNLSGPQFPHL
jgi:hypothetical protein